MPRARDPNRDKAYEIWRENKGEKPLKDIANELDVSEGTLRGWKTKDKWVSKLNGTLQSNEGNAPNDDLAGKSVTSSGQSVKKRGNPNPTPKFPKRNTESVKHGFFSKYLPQESLDIMEEMQERSPADLIWDQIQIQYAAIIRAQKIMFVADKDDMAKEQTQYAFGESGADKYDVQFAWDRHATFLNAQSRAMSELRGLIKQFNELASEDDMRRLKLEQMKLGIEKTKAEIETLNDDGQQEENIEIRIVRKGERT
ncbi:phage terminase small subunit [Rossellomorea marisflavi]|uniref:phage terminase small subunit n=1 Tax=Rossellomorea marisflavi TaxID=189381 RepID=UPI00345DD48B